MAVHDELIAEAAGLLNLHRVGDRLFGDVASALVARTGEHFVGVCIDTGSTGFCAEQAAIAAMVTAGQYAVAAIVAVYRQDDAQLLSFPPAAAAGSSSDRSTRRTSTPASFWAATSRYRCASCYRGTSGQNRWRSAPPVENRMMGGEQRCGATAITSDEG